MVNIGRETVCLASSLHMHKNRQASTKNFGKRQNPKGSSNEFQFTTSWLLPKLACYITLVKHTLYSCRRRRVYESAPVLFFVWRFKSDNRFFLSNLSRPINPRSLEGGGGGGGGQIDPLPPRFFWLWIFAPWLIVKSFGTTVPCLWTHLLTLIKWRHRWWRHRKKSCNLCVDCEISIFR